MLELATKPILKLNMITSLFESLHENDILYCHWKSNEHLGASMKGETDLDILFNNNQKEKLELILQELGFKRFDAIRQKQYKDIVDFIGLDFESGKIVHLHTHYRLTMGEPYLKGYQLNIESHVLNSRVHDEEFDVYCTRPALELILLYLRESLKLRHRDMILRNLKNKTKSNEYVLREYHWLKNRATDAEVLAILKTIFSNYKAIYEFVTGEFNIRQLSRLAPIIKREPVVKRLYAPVTALILRWQREATIIISRKLALLLDEPILVKRNNPRGGVVVAVIGADGSGKSTVTENLKRTFEGKLDLYKIYFGRGDGKISLSRKALTSTKKFLWTGENNSKTHQEYHPSRKEGIVRSAYKCVQALLVALEKRNNLKRMRTAKKKGALVICDRYPQNQIMGYNDGPLLHSLLNSKNPLFRAMAKIESQIYRQAERHAPDILFKLIANEEVVEKRKPGETSLEKLKTKIEGVKQLRFKDTCKVITIDAARPLNNVLYIIKKEIWNTL